MGGLSYSKGAWHLPCLRVLPSFQNVSLKPFTHQEEADGTLV